MPVYDPNMSDVQSTPNLHKQRGGITIYRATLGLIAAWLALVAGLGWFLSQRSTAAYLDRLTASAEYDVATNARVVERLFTELVSITNMVAGHAQVVQLASRYRIDPSGFADLTRQQRAEEFIDDPLARQVGTFMNGLAEDLDYARIYLSNLSDDTVTSSNWNEPDSIVGMIYSGRPYLSDALRNGVGTSFGIARLLKTQSYFVASRIEDVNGAPLGAITAKFDAPDMAAYLTGQHTSLIVNGQGRVITTSSAPFMLRNVAALLPPDAILPPDGEESLGDPLDVSKIDISNSTEQWLIGGKSYLIRRQSLVGTPYWMMSLASLDDLMSMHRYHLQTAGWVAVFGLIFILLCNRIAAQLTERRLRVEQGRNLAISKAAERDLATKVQERTAQLTKSNTSLKAEIERRHLLEEKLRQSLASVNSALAQQRDFVAMVSHEFRSPLATISAAVDNLIVLLDEPSEGVKLRIGKIRRTVERMSSIIGNVLAGDRLVAGTEPSVMFERFDLRDALHSVISGLNEHDVKRVHISRCDTAMVECDRTLAEIALENLLQNALKYSNAKDSITVGVSIDREWVFINITDQGDGIPLEVQDLIFMKYYRIPGQRKRGSGLGLYISREIAQLMGGNLVLAASGEGGSTFSLSLPIEMPDCSLNTEVEALAGTKSFHSAKPHLHDGKVAERC